MWVGTDISARALVLVSVALLWAGCSSNKDQGTGCVQGLTRPCTCDNGSPGVRSCLADNTFGSCSCGNSGAIPTGKGTGGSGAVGSASPGTGGQGTAGVTAGTGGQNSAGPAGMSGGAGAQGMSGAGGQASLRPAYGPCRMSTDCRVNAMCTATGTAVGYCSPLCNNSGMGNNQCTRPNSGDVRVSCIAGRCVIGSCDQAQCPSGMTCVQTMTTTPSGPQTDFSCVYPAL
jgi:hypothetical protein